jgi:hypothetical protein
MDAKAALARRVSPREWGWAAAFSLVVMALTSVPYLAAAASQSAAWRFGGFLLAVEDGNSYIAKMSEGAHGAWLFTLTYSSEPQRGALLFTFYLLLGHLAGTNHDAQVLVYHLARVLCGVALLLTCYLFLAEFLPRVRQRRLALLLVALGGGLGWAVTIAFPRGLLGSLPVDFISPEAFSLLVLFGFPHLALARCLLLLGLVAFLRGRGVLAGLALFASAVVQPLAVIAVWMVIGVFLVLSGLWLRRAASRPAAPAALVELNASLSGWRRDARNWVVLGLLSAPPVLYTVYVFSVDPVLRQWNAQNYLPSPSPIHYLLAYGVWLAFAIPGWWVLWQRRPRLALLAGGWVLAAALLLYTPIPTQRRLIEGVQLPLAVLAVLGLTVALRRLRRWLVPAVLALTLPTAALLWTGALLAARAPAEPIFHPADQVAAFDWLAEHGQVGQVVLSAYATGNPLPAYAPLIAYIGHGPETVFLAAKAPRVAAFYSTAPDADRLRLLADGRIRYVIEGPHERALGSFDPAPVPYLAWRYANDTYAIYEVRP